MTREEKNFIQWLYWIGKNVRRKGLPYFKKWYKGNGRSILLNTQEGYARKRGTGPYTY